MIGKNSNSISYQVLQDEIGALPTPQTQIAGCAVNTSGSVLAVVIGGTPIPLSSMSYNNGITLASDILTVEPSGVYYISYQVNTTAALGIGMSTSLYINGSSSYNFIDNPAISTNMFKGEGIVSLTAGSTLELYFSGLLATATLIGNMGAVLTVIKIG